MAREINDLNQELPTAKEWEHFLRNDINKLQLVNLLVMYITSVECTVHLLVMYITSIECTVEKQEFVNNGPNV